MRPIAPFLAILAVCACGTPASDTGGAASSTPADGGNTLTADLVAPAFGDVEWLDLEGTAEATAWIRHTGGPAATVHRIDLVDSALVYDVGDWGDGELAAGDELAVPIWLTPGEPGAYEGRLEVELRAEGQAPLLLQATLETDVVDGVFTMDGPLDFGTVDVGCTAEVTTTVANDGDGVLAVDALESSAPQVTVTLPDDRWPLLLEPGATATVPLLWEPDASGDLDATLVPTLRGVATEPAPTAVQGTAPDLPVDSSEHRIARWDEADVIGHYDGSLTMDLTSTLETTASTWLSDLSARGVDTRLSYVWADDGCVTGDDLYLDASFSQSDAAQVLDSMMRFRQAYGTRSEKAFEQWAVALDETSAGDCNEGLVRDGAALHLLSFSDEPEQSAQPYTHYVPYFQGLLTHPELLRIHGVGGLPGGTCVAEYLGVIEAAAMTGGGFWSICGDLQATLADLQDEIVQTSVELADAARALDLSADIGPRGIHPDSLAVDLDGVPVAGGWTWDADASVLTLADTPPAGATATVSWTPLADCE